MNFTVHRCRLRATSVTDVTLVDLSPILFHQVALDLTGKRIIKRFENVDSRKSVPDKQDLLLRAAIIIVRRAATLNECQPR